MKLATKILIGAGILAIYLKVKDSKAIDSNPELIPVSYLPGNYNALTIPPFGIFILQSQLQNRNLINHELIHWQQYQQIGLVNYHATYLRDLFKYGYDKMPMEISARFNESDFCRNNYTECVRTGLARTVINKNFRA